MAEGFVMNSKTCTALSRTLESGTQSILLSGPKGVGLSEVLVETLGSSPAHVFWLRPERDGEVSYEKGSITIDQIRELYELLKTRHKTARIVAIDAAETMAEAAQNAFLKLLEEPPTGVQFVLLSHAPQLLLPTIRSRVQAVDALPVARQQSEALLDDLDVTDTTARAQLLFIADGLPAELTRLASSSDALAERASIVRDARTLLQGSPYERMQVAHAYKDAREKALLLLSDAMKLLSQALKSTANTELTIKINRLHAIYDAVKQNGNIRLQLAAALVV